MLLPLQSPCAVVCPPTSWPAVGHWSAQKLLPKFNITPRKVIILAADIGDWFSLKNAKDCPPLDSNSEPFNSINFYFNDQFQYYHV